MHGWVQTILNLIQFLTWNILWNYPPCDESNPIISQSSTGNGMFNFFFFNLMKNQIKTVNGGRSSWPMAEGPLVCPWLCILSYLIEIDTNRCLGFEILAFDLFLSNRATCRYVCVYLPPSGSHDKDTVKLLLEVLKSLIPSHEIYIVGDFNFSNINWDNVNSITTGRNFTDFKHFLDIFNLKQMINFSTHNHGSTLDLIITSKPSNIINI